jgi:hypothetical protein
VADEQNRHASHPCAKSLFRPSLSGEANKAGEDLRFARNAELRSLGVEPIWIDSFDEVETIFYRIKARAGS